MKRMHFLGIFKFDLGDRIAIDSLMIICGILAVIANGLIAAMASSITSD